MLTAGHMMNGYWVNSTGSLSAPVTPATTAMMTAGATITPSMRNGRIFDLADRPRP